jgi:hypothetical protein
VWLIASVGHHQREGFDPVKEKPPEQVRGRAFAKGRSGGIRALQPEDEIPL